MVYAPFCKSLGLRESLAIQTTTTWFPPVPPKASTNRFVVNHQPTKHLSLMVEVVNLQQHTVFQLAIHGRFPSLLQDLCTHVSCGLLSSKSLRNHHPIHTSSDPGQVVTKWFFPEVVVKRGRCHSYQLYSTIVTWHDLLQLFIVSFRPFFAPNCLPKLQQMWSMKIHHLLSTSWNLMTCHHSPLPKARLQGTAVQQTQQTNPWEKLSDQGWW